MPSTESPAFNASDTESGSAPVEFVMVSGLLVALVLAALQVSFVGMYRTVVTDAVVSGSAYAALADVPDSAGVVRAHRAWQAVGGQAGGFRLILGARLVFADATPDVIAYPQTRRGWGRLTRLLTLGNRRAAKGECQLFLADLLAHAEDLALVAMDGDAPLLGALRAAAPRVWLAATMPRGGSDARRLAQRMALAECAQVPLIATNDALYAVPGDRPLQDVLTCIREGLTLQSAGRRLAVNAERHLKLRLACALANRSAQQLVTEALDRMLEDLPDVTQVAAQVARQPK